MHTWTFAAKIQARTELKIPFFLPVSHSGGERRILHSMYAWKSRQKWSLGPSLLVSAESVAEEGRKRFGILACLNFGRWDQGMCKFEIFLLFPPRSFLQREQTGERRSPSSVLAWTSAAKIQACMEPQIPISPWRAHRGREMIVRCM